MSFDDKRLVFGGAPPGSPWGTLGEITARALAPLGYEVRIEPEASRGRCPGMLTGGLVDLGATQAITTAWAYKGIHGYTKEGAYPRLRALATIMHPAWLGVAVRWDTGITDLGQIRERKLPVRVIGGVGEMFEAIWAHYGLSRELIESWGGRFLPAVVRGGDGVIGTSPWVRSGEVDVIMDNIYAAYTIEAAAFHEAAILMNLRFLPLPDDLIQTICRDLGGDPGFIPYRLVRGVLAPTASVYRPYQLIFGRDDMPDDFAYLLAKELDERRHLFRETLLPYSYDSKTVAHNHGIPLHPSAERYYREVGYLGSSARPELVEGRVGV
jgi:TRAP-type uncharacterized transport system substrate-binding protein